MASLAEVARFEHEGRLSSVAWSPDGSRVATGCMDNTCRIFDMASLKHDGTVSGVAWSPDGSRVATCFDNTCRIFDMASLAEVARFEHEGRVCSVAWSLDGSRVATGCFDQTCRIFDMASLAEVARFEHEGRVCSVAWSLDGSRVATGCFDQTCRIFDMASLAEVARLKHDGTVSGVAWSPDGSRVATCFDNTCRIFDMASLAEVARFEHEGRVCSVAWSLDGSRVATGCFDQTCRIFDMASLAEVARLEHEGVVYSVAWSPDGSRVATGCFDQTCRILVFRLGHSMGSAFALNDAPGSESDHLDYQRFASALLSVACASTSSTPLTIGLLAPWGSGKSKMLHLMRGIIEGYNAAYDMSKVRKTSRCSKSKVAPEPQPPQDAPQHYYLQVEFNSWLYAGSASLWAGLITEIQNAIERKYGVHYLSTARVCKSCWYRYVLLPAIVVGLLVSLIAGLSLLVLYVVHLQEPGMVIPVVVNASDATLHNCNTTSDFQHVLQEASDHMTLEFTGAALQAHLWLGDEEKEAGYELVLTARNTTLYEVAGPHSRLPVAKHNTSSHLNPKVPLSWILTWSTSAHKIELLHAKPKLRILRLYPALLPIHSVRLCADIDSNTSEWQFNAKTRSQFTAAEEYVDGLLGVAGSFFAVGVLGTTLTIFQSLRTTAFQFMARKDAVKPDFTSKMGYMAQVKKELDMLTKDLMHKDQSWIGLLSCDILCRRQERKTRIFIVIDDLDRCPEGKIVEVLQSMVLLSEKTPFIIVLAVDPRIVTKAIESSFGERLLRAGINGCNYLDKILQLTFVIPQMTNADAKAFLEESIKAVDQKKQALQSPPVPTKQQLAIDEETLPGTADAREHPAFDSVKPTPQIAPAIHLVQLQILL